MDGNGHRKGSKIADISNQSQRRKEEKKETESKKTSEKEQK